MTVFLMYFSITHPSKFPLTLSSVQEEGVHPPCGHTISQKRNALEGLNWNKSPSHQSYL